MAVTAKQILAAKNTDAANFAAEAEAAYVPLTAKQKITEATAAARGYPLTDDELKQINALFEKRPKAAKTNTKIAKQVLAAMRLVKRELSAEPKLAAEQKAAAESLIAAVDAAEVAAEKRGYPLSDEELKQLGYVAFEGGTWGLPISVSVLHALREERNA